MAKIHLCKHDLRPAERAEWAITRCRAPHTKKVGQYLLLTSFFFRMCVCLCFIERQCNIYHVSLSLFICKRWSKLKVERCVASQQVQDTRKVSRYLETQIFTERRPVLMLKNDNYDQNRFGGWMRSTGKVWGWVDLDPWTRSRRIYAACERPSWAPRNKPINPIKVLQD